MPVARRERAGELADEGRSAMRDRVCDQKPLVEHHNRILPARHAREPPDVLEQHPRVNP